MGEMFQWLMGFLDREWAVTRRAWKPLVVLALILGGIVLYGASRYYAAFYEETLRTTEQRRAYAQERVEEANRRITVLEARPNTTEEAEARISSLTQTNQELQRKVEVLEQQAAPWVLTDDQRKKLREALNNVPVGETYTIHVHVIAGCNICSVYADDLIAAWEGIPRWEVHGSTNFGLSSRLVGVNVAYDPAACPPDELQLIKKAFDAAGIGGKGFPFNEKDKENIKVPCGVFVGRKPQK